MQLINSPALAQDGRDTTCRLAITGTVFEGKSNTTLPDASIWIKEAKRAVHANVNGEFVIKGLCQGKYTLTVSYVGFTTEEVILSVYQNAHKDFRLKPSSSGLKQVTITDKRKEQNTTQVKNEVSRMELLRVTGKSLGESLKSVTGINTLTTGSSISKPVLHGLHSNRILILNNGVRQEGQQWGSEHAPEIDPFIANSISVVKGAGSVRYGADAIGGVILVEPGPLRDTAGTSGSLNLVGFSNNRMGAASGIAEGNFRRLPPLSWRLQGTYKRAGNNRTPGYYTKNTGIQELNYSGTLAFRKADYGAEVFYSSFHTRLGIFSGAHIGNLTDLQQVFATGQPKPEDISGFSYTIDRPYQQVRHDLFKAKATLNTFDAGMLTATYARQSNRRYEYDKHRPLNEQLAGQNKPELSFEIITHTAELLWEHKTIRHFRGSIGVSGMTQGNATSGRYFIPNFRNYSTGLFLIERWTRNKLEIEAGVRFDYKWQRVFIFEGTTLTKPEFNYRNLSGMAGIIYHIKPDWKLNAHAGNAWRPPGVNELYSDGVHHGAASYEKGDAGLGMEKAANFIASISRDKNKKLNGEVSMYYTLFNGYIYLSPQQPPVLTIRGAFPSYVYKQTQASLAGLDARITCDFDSRLSLTGSASVLRARDKSNQEYLVMMPADRMEAILRYRIKDMGLLKESFLALQVLHVFKQTHVPDSADYAPPPADYTLPALEAGTTIRLNRFPVTITLEISNPFNKKYRDYLNRFRYYTDETGRNISLRIHIPFSFQPKKIN